MYHSKIAKKYCPHKLVFNDQMYPKSNQWISQHKVNYVFTVQIPIKFNCWFNVQDDGKRNIIFLTLSTDEAINIGNPINHSISVPEKEHTVSSRLRPSDHFVSYFLWSSVIIWNLYGPAS